MWRSSGVSRGGKEAAGEVLARLHARPSVRKLASVVQVRRRPPRRSPLRRRHLSIHLDPFF
jgi:hypothetical protein